jgi:hypothetical protein
VTTCTRIHGHQFNRYQLQNQPKKDQNVRLHFDRIAVGSNEAINMVPPADVEIRVLDRGAWSSIGHRKAQEDAFGKCGRWVHPIGVLSLIASISPAFTSHIATSNVFLIDSLSRIHSIARNP